MSWRKIKNYPGYKISSDGRIKSLKTGKIMKPSLSNAGYLMIKLFKNGKHHNKAIHRLVAETFCDGYAPGLEVNHLDGNKINNSYDILKWCSHSENTRHAIENGLFTPYKLPPRPHEGKKVRIIETGEVFNSLTDCADHIGGFKTAISACLIGKVKSHKGYHFEEAR